MKKNKKELISQLTNCRKTLTVIIIPLQADAFRGLAPSRFVALRLQGLDGFAFPQKRHWPKPARASLCDEASGAMQEQWFFAAFRFIHFSCFFTGIHM
ncbi:hypothetical protein [Planococcus glaciei]|uniref:hypothetical protein n=1 Tax=Planococcus glaciei TaxID=459472 RepID=UPI00128E25C3|nr:hypothetical protein [Planococcus glaciei]